MPSFASHEFADYCRELLSASLERDCVARRMFGGHGISTDGLTFALVAGETLYLKTDETSQARWADAGGQPFAYEAKGKTVRLRYHSAPAQALESPAAMAEWARLALQSAMRAQAHAVGKGQARARQDPPPWR